MDGKWSLPLTPTACPDGSAAIDKFVEIFPEFRKVSNSEFTIDQVRGLTTELIKRHSYCPSTWTSRAYNLLTLGYPDLAIGDACKARMLLEYYQYHAGEITAAVTKEVWRQTKESVLLGINSTINANDKPTRMKEYVKRLTDRASMILAQALFLANCYIECYEFLKNYTPKQFPANEKFGQLKEVAERAQIIEDMTRCENGEFVSNMDKDSQEARRSGSILPQIYPWSGPYVRHGETILPAANKEMTRTSNGKCYIGSSNIADEIASTNAVEKEAQTMGVKANTDFASGDLLLVDRTFLSGVDEYATRCCCCRGNFSTTQLQAYEAKCCSARFCGELCKENSQQYHFQTCRRLSSLKEHPSMMLNNSGVSSDTIAMNDLLYRLFAHLENVPAIHPLRTPTVGSMIPAYRNSSNVRFSWTNDIMRPFTMLKILGVNIFTDHGYDTWVIQEIQARIRNNVRAFQDDSGHYHMAINLSYMFFNHSCDPNVKITGHWSGSSHIFATATKHIERDEELCITYLDEEDLELPYAERQEFLKDWTGGECQCHRCRHERAEAEYTEQNLEQPPLIMLDDSSDEDYEDESDSHTPPNRYATKETLIETHPAIQTLKRKRVPWKQQLSPLNYDDDNNYDCGESPTAKRQK